MGYGFSWEHEPPDVVAADQRADALLAGSDHEAWRAARDEWWALIEKHGSYTSWGYSGFARVVVAEMERRGMVYGGYRDHPPFQPCTGCEGEEPYCPGCIADHAMVGALGPTPEQGIPLYKFSSSDNWLVLPEEITAALDRLMETREQPYGGDPEDERYWNKWVRFMYCARGWGGFRVH